MRQKGFIHIFLLFFIVIILAVVGITTYNNR